MNKFKDKVVWITGSSSGIGEATAYEFAREGARLILTALEADLLEKVAARCIELGAPDAKPLPFDLSKKDEVAGLAEQAWQVFGHIDVFYNNVTKVILPKMIENGGGQLMVTTSINGRFGFPLRCAYSSSKHALYGFFETVQAEYYKDNIRVTIVCPGRVQTRISFYALEKDGKQHAKMDAGQAGGCTPEQAARKIVKAVYRKKREVLVGRKELLMVYIKRFFPGLCAKIARSINPM